MSARHTLFLGFASLGAIYGDIGTSPLYVFTSIFPEGNPSVKDVVGATSCIFWLFFLIVIVKYCLVVLRFGPNNNEGGQIAIYAKIASCLHIGPRGVDMSGQQDLLALTRSETHDSFDLEDENISKKRFWVPKDGRYNKTLVKSFLAPFTMGLCFFGCALVMSDGLLTPTTSVLSAIEGLAVAVPKLSNAVMPISCVVLLLLFAIQGLGSGVVSLVFAPIIFVWFLLLLATGAYNIAQHDPKIFRALNPADAIHFLQRHGISKLGFVMLSITGTEAMFADIGHFSRLSVQLTLGTFVFPCLMVHYLGQAAFLCHYPTAVANVFYLSAPGGVSSPMYWVMFVFATLSTVIASQALILGVFSIVRQLIHLDCFPSFKIVHKSSKSRGQIYIPVVNYILMVLVICTTVGFKHSARVTNAYGLGVALDFVVTSILISICLLYVYKAHIALILFFAAVFIPLEMCLVVAGLLKVPHGAWFPLVVTIVMTLFITFWRWCRSLHVNQEYADRIRLMSFMKTPSEILDLGHNARRLQTAKSERLTGTCTYVDPHYTISCCGQQYVLTRYPGLGIMYTNTLHNGHAASTVPKLFHSLVTSCPSLPSAFVFLSFRVTAEPYISWHDHVSVTPIKSLQGSGLYRCVVKFGFMDAMHLDRLTIRHIQDLVAGESLDEEEIDIDVGKAGFDDAEPQDHEAQDVELRAWIAAQGAATPVSNRTTRVLHVLDRSLVSSKRYHPEDYADGNGAIKFCAKARYWFRSVLIDQIFVPVSSLFGGYERVLDSAEQEVLFCGTSVKM